jgi:cytochrome c oxidase cbb3-type subunit 2
LLNDPSLSFTLISRTVSPPLIAAALGEILILAAALAFAIDLARLLTSSVDSPPASEPIAAAPQPPNKSPWTPLFCLGISLTLSVSWLACLAGPILQLNALGQEPDAGVDPQLYAVPRSGLALQGAEVYRANGCAACHTQQVRPALDGPDLARGWGKRRTVARDFIFDDPAMPGTIRLGPDLANIGLRQNPAAFLARLRQPSSVVKGARMPPFAFLFETGADGASRPRPEAFALAAYLQSLHSGAFLYEAPRPRRLRPPLLPMPPIHRHGRPPESPAAGRSRMGTGPRPRPHRPRPTRRLHWRNQHPGKNLEPEHALVSVTLLHSRRMGQPRLPHPP